MVVAGPYDMTQSSIDLRGSCNQTLHRLSARADQRYTDAWLAHFDQVRTFSLACIGDDVQWSGLPRQGDLVTLEDMLEARGLTWKGVSWRGRKGDLESTNRAK
jgi:hypothetical protein